MAATSSASIRALISGIGRVAEVKHLPAAGSAVDAERAKSFCAELETGNMIYFPRSPILLTAVDSEFLLGTNKPDQRCTRTLRTGRGKIGSTG